MIHLATVILVAVAISPAQCEDHSWKNNVEYFERVDLDCAKFNLNQDVIHSVEAWILPSGTIWKPGAVIPGRHIIIRDNGFVLTIDRLDDDDFGVYYCVVDTGVNGTNIIKIGVNVDGPYFNPTFLKDIKHSAMVGGIAGGCTLVVLVILWLVCAYFTKASVPRNMQKKPSVSADMKGGPPTEYFKMTKIDDSVYYNADEVTSNELPEEVRNTWTLSSTSSGDYHSIDSIDRNKKLQTTDPGEVYNNYVKSVHM